MNIAVYGFMGVGKSTVGRLLAERLDYSFTDMDEAIGQREGTVISAIFTEKGEPYFRQLETELIKELAEGDNQVIACGGGAVIAPENQKALRDSARLIYLTASIPEIIKRTSRDNTRPLLNVDDPMKAAQLLLGKREPVYMSLAEVTVDTTGLTPKHVVDKILEELM